MCRLLFNERSFDDVVALIAVSGFCKTARINYLAQLLQHTLASAQHESVVTGIWFRYPQIQKQFT